MKRYKVRFTFLSILGAYSGSGAAQRIPVNCWRCTFVVCGKDPTTGPILDGANMGKLLMGEGNVSFAVGGVWNPDGSPAMIDQQLLLGFVTEGDTSNRALLVFETLEPVPHG